MNYLLPESQAPAADLNLDLLLQQAVAGITGLPGSLVRPRWQPVAPKQPEPSVNWIAIGITEIRELGLPFEQHNGSDDNGLGDDTLIRHEQITVRATCYGQQSQQYASLLRDGLCVPTNLGSLQYAGLAFSGITSEIRSVPDQVNNVWRRRYDFTAEFRRMITRTYGIRNIASADMKVDTEQGNLTEVVVSDPH